MHKTVKFLIDGKGNIAVDMDGFEGKGCDDLQDQITGMLSGTVTEEEIKPEYHLDNQNGNTISNRG